MDKIQMVLEEEFMRKTRERKRMLWIHIEVCGKMQ